MAKTNHWGYELDSDVPTTGVFHATNLEHIYEEAMEVPDSIDLSWEEHKLNCEEFQEKEECDCEYESDRFLIGFKLTKMSLFEPNLEADFSAILNSESNTLQVVRSKWGIRCALCSPCYPGQGDGDTPGEFLAFAPNPEVAGDIVSELKGRIFLLEEGKNGN